MQSKSLLCRNRRNGILYPCTNVVVDHRIHSVLASRDRRPLHHLASRRVLGYSFFCVGVPSICNSVFQNACGIVPHCLYSTLDDFLRHRPWRSQPHVEIRLFVGQRKGASESHSTPASPVYLSSSLCSYSPIEFVEIPSTIFEVLSF